MFSSLGASLLSPGGEAEFVLHGHMDLLLRVDPCSFALTFSALHLYEKEILLHYNPGVRTVLSYGMLCVL